MPAVDLSSQIDKQHEHKEPFKLRKIFAAAIENSNFLPETQCKTLDHWPDSIQTA